MSAVEWVDVGLRAVFFVAGNLLSIWFFFLVYRMFQQGMSSLNPVLARQATPSFSMFLRRAWCRHRVVARTRDPYGRHMTACARCGSDVNAGRPREEWR